MNDLPRSIRRKVIEKLSERVYLDFLRFVLDHEPNFWGGRRPVGFDEMNVVLALYKDLTGKGYAKILQEIQLPFAFNIKSLVHNTKVVRSIGRCWGESKVKLGDLNDWKEATADAHQSRHLPTIHLWCDSTDLPLQKWRGCSRKGTDWSYKLNRPGQRYMAVMDGEGQGSVGWLFSEALRFRFP